MIGIIYNPLSRKGQNRHRVEEIRKILDEKGCSYEYRETECPMDGIRVGREVSENCDIVVAVGGDGTVNEVLNGVYENGATLGVLPFGSGNDIARSLEVYDKTDEQLADMIINPNIRNMDVGNIGDRRFTLFVSFGIVASIIKNYIAMKNPGKTAYPRAAIKAITKHKAKSYHVKLPDREFDCTADFLSIQNTPTAGGGLYIYRQGSDCDGHMDLVIVHHVGRFRLLCNAIALLTGKLEKQKNVEVIPVTTVDITTEKETGSVDGELVDFESVHMVMDAPIKVLH